MKKGLLVMLGLTMVIFLAACDKWQQQSNLVVEENNNPDVVVDLGEWNEVENVEIDNWSVNSGEIDNVEGDNDNEIKTSLTLADLNEIEILSFPLSYSYERYWREDSEPSDSGTYVYPEGDHWLLLPIYENIVSKEVVDSESDWWWIYTVVNAVLDDESERSIVYMNDPVTLRYVAATVSDGEWSTLYSFNY